MYSSNLLVLVVINLIDRRLMDKRTIVSEKTTLHKILVTISISINSVCAKRDNVVQVANIKVTIQ